MFGGTAERSPPASRRKVGRYEIFSELAKGGMATVHLGRVIGAGKFARTVAIKRLHDQYASDPDFARMFLDEAELVARVRHPNVVPTLDLIEQQGELFIVMEFVDGATLKQLLRTADRNGERVPWNVALTIMDGVLRGLHAAHEARNERGEPLGLVHRDVSPDNILVGTDGFARVFDFGIAKALGQAHTTQDGHVKGKVAYMTPEQLLGKVATRRVDVFSASVVLWEALTGRRLFASPDVGQSMHRLLHLEIPPPTALAPHLPPDLDGLVLRGLEREPSKRYATAQVMAEAIGSVGGLASLGEVGEWVRDVAEEHLAAVAARIAAMEQSAPVRAPAGTAAQQLEPAASAPAVADEPDEVTAGGTRLALAQETTSSTVRAAARRKRSLLLAALLIGAAAIGVVAFFGGMWTGSPAAGGEPLPAASAPGGPALAGTASHAEPSTSAPPAAVTATSATASATASASAPASDPSGAVPTASTTTEPPRSTVPQRRPPGWGTPAPTKRPAEGPPLYSLE